VSERKTKKPKKKKKKRNPCFSIHVFAFGGKSMASMSKKMFCHHKRKSRV
jgi:hypothetical protein